MNDNQMKEYLKSLGYILEENGIEIWHELAINEGYNWDEIKEVWI